ncbi:MAG TPA: twin-arginine translocase subunit TatC [Thermoleophilaceae bacterium]|nr:twin-arginine translocase subunit TatC [Thermoleophilaceae bacterium]
MPRTRIKPIDHEERLTIVDHLDELRSRLILCAIAFGTVFALTTWQNHRILEIVNRPLPDNLPEPITFGITEPFTTTLTNAAYAAILISLPFLLYQVYAFILPAFSPKERRVATPLLMMVPVLFTAGVVFCYFVVLPPATDFLLAFNSSEFNTQVRARDYYSFVTLTMAAMGMGFQVPVAILAAVKLGITSPEKLRKNRRYAVLVIAIVAAFLPTIDPVTLLLEMVPLLLLYEFSILLAQWVGGHREEPVTDAEAGAS